MNDLAAIKIRDINFAYNEEQIFTNYSLNISEGSFVCITGESGCGKSTLLKLINGLLIPQRGEIKIGKNLLNLKHLVEMRRNMGYILQEDSLFPHLTAYQNMIYCLKLRNYSTQLSKDRINELLPLVNLDSEILNKFPHQLSGGQRQRVGIIRGIVHKPKIVLMDEPFSALDQETRSNLQDLVKTIHKSTKTTFVMVTHSISEAKYLGTEIINL